MTGLAWASEAPAMDGDSKDLRLHVPHVPVMAEEMLRILITDRDGIYLDLNVGEAGHAERICTALSGADYRYIGIDRDPRALEVSRRKLAAFGDRVRLVESNHRDFPSVLDREGIDRVTGILFDLGLSSAQLSAPERGFAFDLDGPLDMRYGPTGPTAGEVLDSMPERELISALRMYGDVAAAPRLARAIVTERLRKPLGTTGELRALIEQTLRPAPWRRRKILAQVFQTLRTLANDEVAAFGEALAACENRVRVAGVLVVIAYESVTDRMVKRFFAPADEPRDAFGHSLIPPRWERITKKALRPGPEEIAANPRARSGRLRAARRLSGGGA